MSNDWIESKLVTPENLRNPPAGVSYEPSERGFEVSIPMRSNWSLVLLPAAGYLSAKVIFLSLEIFQGQPGTHERLFLSLVVFYLATAALWWGVLLLVFGRIVIRVDGESGSIFKGIGTLGWTRRFNWGGVRKISLTTRNTEEGKSEQITLEGEKTIHVARGVNHERRRYLLMVLSWNQRPSAR